MYITTGLLLFVAYISVVIGKPTDQLKLEAADNGFIFEGDMVMPKKTIEAALKGNIDDGDRKDPGYSLLRSLKRRWPNGKVPFVFDSSIKNKVLNVVGLKGPTEAAIRNAMSKWEEKTCVKFVERNRERDYIRFIDAGFGKCYSHVGKTGGEQKISLGFGCFTTGIAIHEIGHALGLYHEQSRPDRDNYVEILWDNIKEDNKHNFEKYDRGKINSRGSPYDYDSIMHYEWNAFAKIPLVQRTIRAKKSGVSFGQRSHISIQDAFQINKYYDCKI